MSSDLRRHLSPEAWNWLVILAPFTGVIHAERLPLYTASLGLGSRRLAHLLTTWQAEGILLPDARDPAYLSLSPEVKAELQAALEADPERREAAEHAFLEHYEALASTLQEMARTEEVYAVPEGAHTVAFERDNLETALRLAIRRGRPLVTLYGPLAGYYGPEERVRAIALGEEVVAELSRRRAVESRENEIELLAALGALGTQYKEQGEYTRARARLERVLHLLARFKGIPPELVAMLSGHTHFQLGAIAYAQEKWNRAEYHFERMLEVTEEDSNPSDDVQAFVYLGRIAAKRNDWQAADEHFARAMDVAVEEEDELLQAEIYRAMSATELAQQHWKEANELISKALILAYKIEIPALQAAIWRQIGAMAEAQHEWVEAEASYRTAVAHYRAGEWPQQAIAVYRDLVHLAERQGARDREYKYLLEAAGLARELQSERLLQEIDYEMGRRAARDGRWRKAIADLLKVIELDRLTSNTTLREQALRALAALWYQGHNTVPRRVATVLGIAPQEAQELLQQALPRPGGNDPKQD